MAVTLGQGALAGFDEPIRVLMDCHRRIEKFLSLLLRVADECRGEAMGSEYREAAESALRYFANAAPHHTADEEQSLFPALRRHADDPRVAEALRRIALLEADHDKADAAHARVAELMQRWLDEGTLPAAPLAELRETLATLHATYVRHIAEEDEVIFPLAAEVLAREVLIDVGRSMANRRGIEPNTTGPRCKHAQPNHHAKQDHS
ncbi:hemerythrin domain-containing protein [Phycisphaerales bacterium AB-hyl4]|uniref:Hemerythrin domain-containing protein n=1 Tax=Natronomicrosphaera hydrolytica TaxID=3242702 RepID=A0ABV4U564_9BACT